MQSDHRARSGALATSVKLHSYAGDRVYALGGRRSMEDEAFVVVDGPLFGGWGGRIGEHQVNLVVDVLRGLRGFDPTSVEVAVVVVAERGDVDAWAASTG